MYKVNNDKGLLQWTTYISPFSWLSWICIVIVVIGSTMLYSFIVRFRLKSSKSNRNSSHWTSGIHAFLAQGQPQEPVESSPRIAFLVLFGTGILLWFHYSATLTSFLAAEVEKVPFATMNEMLYQTNYKLVTKSGFFVGLVIEHLKVNIHLRFDIINNDINS